MVCDCAPPSDQDRNVKPACAGAPTLSAYASQDTMVAGATIDVPFTVSVRPLGMLAKEMLTRRGSTLRVVVALSPPLSVAVRRSSRKLVCVAARSSGAGAVRLRSLPAVGGKY